VRGHKLEDLLNLSYLEKVFLHYARLEYYEEEKLKWKSILSDVMNGGERN
jgi:hypothetical protein